MADENKINLNPETSLNTAEKLKQSGFDVEVDGKQVNIDEGDTMLDLFPELSEEQPMDGGEVKDVKTEKSKNKDKKNEVKKTESKIKKEFFMSKKELLESIGVYEAEAPSPVKPKIKPGEKTKPGHGKPKTPFRPKHSPRPKAVGDKLPTWLSANALGIGANNPAPVKTPTRTKPGEKQRPKTPKTPFRPKHDPRPKATAMTESKKNKRK